MNVVVAEQALALARSRQRRYDDCIGPEKRRAKARAAAIIGRRPGAKVLDVGHEPFYAPEFETRGMTLVPLNLPDGDMHTLSAVEEYDGALAMHVLEHSPFPLYVLMLLHRAIRPGGWLYAAVPAPRKKWLKHEAHFATLKPMGWHRMLADAGFRVGHYETGLFGPRSKEARFLCTREGA